MKTLVLANQKGGVGKSAIAVQFAFYVALVLRRRVLFIDLDHQCNSTKALGELVTVSRHNSCQVLNIQVDDLEKGNFVLIPGTPDLTEMEKRASEHNHYATHFVSLLRRVDAEFDLCVIDTHPNPDIRQLSALLGADFVLLPIQLNQEALDGIGGLIYSKIIGIQNIQRTLNPKLELIGILPNLVEPCPLHIYCVAAQKAIELNELC